MEVGHFKVGDGVTVQYAYDKVPATVIKTTERSVFIQLDKVKEDGTFSRDLEGNVYKFIYDEINQRYRSRGDWGIYLIEGRTSYNANF